MAQVEAEAVARWQDMTQRLAALPENERKGIEFNRDKTGKTVMTAKGQISPTAANAILDSGMLDQSAKAVLRDVLMSLQNPNKSTFDTRYYTVHKRRGSKMVAGVEKASHNEILPYSVELNSKDGVLIRAVDMTKVRDRLVTSLTKPQFKQLYSNPADALKDLGRYMENITQINPIDSATLLGGGEKGAKKRNLFYETLGFRLRNGESLVNAPESIINKSQDTIKSYRAERFAKLVNSGHAFAFEEATTYERAMRNFQPDSFTKETLPAGETLTNPDGYRILKKTGSKLFRVYDDKGELIGTTSTEQSAMRKGQADFIKKSAKEEKRFQPISPEQDAAYLSAVKAGDMEKAQRLVDEAPKAAGYVIEAWHSTFAEPFTEFDMQKAGTSTGGWLPVRGMFFSKDKNHESHLPENREGLRVGKFQLHLNNPLYAKNYGDVDIKLGGDFDQRPDEGLARLKELGYDSIIIDGGEEIIAISPNQIKSADPVTYDDAGNVIPLSQRFNTGSPDIRFQPDPASPNILVDSKGNRIIKSASGKYRVYNITGALLGVRESEQSAIKLATK